MKQAGGNAIENHFQQHGEPAPACVLCPQCGGDGYELQPACCGNGQLECCADGCTGPIASQASCPSCGGSGLANSEEAVVVDEKINQGANT